MVVHLQLRQGAAGGGDDPQTPADLDRDPGFQAVWHLGRHESSSRLDTPPTISFFTSLPPSSWSAASQETYLSSTTSDRTEHFRKYRHTLRKFSIASFMDSQSGRPTVLMKA